MTSFFRGLVAALGLALAMGLQTTAKATTLDDFDGTWVNTDANTRGITRLVIDVTGGSATLHAYGRCHPNDCDWGTVPANSATNTLIVATYDQGFKQSVFAIREVAGGEIEAQVVSQFLDGSGRPDRVDTHRFRRQLVLVPHPIPVPGLGAGLSAPTLLSPAAGTDLNHFPRQLTLVWQPVAGAARYGVEVDCFHCCQAGQWCADLGRTWSTTETVVPLHTLSFVGAQPGRWRAWAIRADGTAGPMSEWREFTFTQ